MSPLRESRGRAGVRPRCQATPPSWRLASQLPASRTRALQSRRDCPGLAKAGSPWPPNMGGLAQDGAVTVPVGRPRLLGVAWRSALLDRPLKVARRQGRCVPLAPSAAIRRARRDGTGNELHPPRSGCGPGVDKSPFLRSPHLLNCHWGRRAVNLVRLDQKSKTKRNLTLPTLLAAVGHERPLRGLL